MKTKLSTIALLFGLFALGLPAKAETVTANTTVTSQSFTAGTAAPTVAEASDFTAAADSSGSLAGKYLKFYSASDAKCYAPWFKVSGTGTAPTVAGCTLVEIDITTDDTATTVAGDLRTVLNAAPYTTYFAVTGATTHLIVTSVLKGTATDGNVGTSGFTVSKTQGVSGSLALAASALLPSALGWRICNAAINSSTWLAVGKTTDPEVDGVRLGPGKCFDCPACTKAALGAVKLSAQAAADAYSVVQFK